MPDVRTVNRLIHEKSPYLLQHTHNPVDWYPWGDEAFAKAQEEDRPVFLSIGYSTCHWCHVMERESFEDQAVADLLNRNFVAIKVDREERPDIDQVYMDACQAMTGQGGWPLTIIMTPDKKPFYAGTYLPKEGKWGLTGLIELLTHVAELWTNDRKQLLEAGEEIVRSIQPRVLRADGELSPETLNLAVHNLESSFDPAYGGFSRAPKFPMPHQLVFLLRHYHLTGQEKAREIAETTLGGMSRGGIRDHIGFGFSRYSTDREWLVPHFEKMLYDNALLALAYLEAFQVTGRPEWSRIASEIFTYVLRDMTSPEGGFYSAEDADSEGVEGKFYLWTPDEVEKVLGESLGRWYNQAYDITTQGNFEGKSIPNQVRRDIPELVEDQNAWPGENLWATLENARANLFTHREKRVRPHKDDKILTAWNGLMIAALARGGSVLQNRQYTEAAERAARFIHQNLYRGDGRLLARYRDGEAAHLAYLDDYAFLAWGLLELYQATWDPAHLGWALSLVRQMQDLFWDGTNGGFYFIGRDAEQLLFRPKDAYDGALPSGNSAAALVLERLARLTGDPAVEQAARQQMDAFSGEVAYFPTDHTLFLQAVQWEIGKTAEVVIAGERGDEETEAMLRVVQENYLPLTAAIFHPAGPEGAAIEELAPYVREQKALDGRATAYVCRNHACQAPVHTAEELKEKLGLSKREMV